MNDLSVNVEAKQGEISFNLSALKDALSVEMEKYKNLIVTEDTVKESKKDLATLRKARKELNDRKIEVKKSFMEPYTKFEDEVKEALKIIDEPIEVIDKQVKEFELAERQRKKEHCREFYESIIGDMKEFIPFEKVFREDWLNASSKDRDIIEAVDIRKIQVQNDLNAIKALNSEIEDDLIANYKSFGDLSLAIQKNSFYLESKAKAEKKIEEERKAEEEKTAMSEELTFDEYQEHSVYLGFTFRVKDTDAKKVIDFLKFSGIEYEEV